MFRHGRRLRAQKLAAMSQPRRAMVAARVSRRCSSLKEIVPQSVPTIGTRPHCHAIKREEPIDGCAENRLGDRSRQWSRASRHTRALARRLCGGARRTAPRDARSGGQGGERQDPRRADRRQRAGFDPRAVRQDQGSVRPARRAVQQCRHRCARRPHRRDSAGQVAGGRRHQLHRACFCAPRRRSS